MIQRLKNKQIEVILDYQIKTNAFDNGYPHQAPGTISAHHNYVIQTSDNTVQFTTCLRVWPKTEKVHILLILPTWSPVITFSSFYPSLIIGKP